MKSGDTSTPAYARMVWLTRPFPDFDFRFIKPLRQKAATLLNLTQGDRVLDLGCGMGGSFPFLVNAVGISGEVVGVEISPEVAINTRNRIAKNNWKNVSVIESPAQTVVLTGTFDGALMFAAPNVYASHEALENIFAHLKDNSRVVLFGAKTSSNWVGKVMNSFFQKVFSKLTFKTTPGITGEPWKMLAERLEQFEVEEYFFGWMFLASGVFVGKKK